jgi:transposase-like protein
MPLPAPSSIREFQQMFPDESACVDYVFTLRWPDGFLCPSCGENAHYFYPARKAVVCKGCRKHVRLTAGTMMHRSKLPLSTWFYGAFLVSTLTPGISAVQFQRQLGISRYETAFQVLHKIRSAMVAPGREPLHGVIELDETLVGGVHKGGKRGRSTEKKTLVVGAVEVRPGKKRPIVAGGVRLRAIPAASGAILDAFLKEHVGPGTIVHTDGHQGYQDLAKLGYEHRPETKAKLPLIHREFANLKTWLRGTHHDRVERGHLQAYLNEFCFRHNRRFWPFSAFHRLLSIGMNARAPTYRELYGADEFGRTIHRS